MRQRDMSARLQEWVVQVDARDDGERIDRLLARRLAFHSRTELKAILQEGRVSSYETWQRNGKATLRLRPSHRVAAGQLITVTLDAPFLRDAESDQAEPLPETAILFEDDHIVAINKPSGCAVHPTRRHPSGSLVELLHRRSRNLGQGSHPTPCHRLDFETSGVVMFAKTQPARTALGRLFEHDQGNDNSLTKVYQAVVRSVPQRPRGTVRLAIGADAASEIPLRRRAFDESERPPCAQACLTHWRLLRSNQVGSRSLLEFRPITGRQHQIRVHAAAMGHVILGESLYHYDDSPNDNNGHEAGDALFLRKINDGLTASDLVLLASPRLALHATSICFPHPIDQTRTMIEAPLPIALGELLAD